MLFGADKRDRTADLLNATDKRARCKIENAARKAGGPGRDSVKGAVLEPLSRSITRAQAIVFARISRFSCKNSWRCCILQHLHSVCQKTIISKRNLQKCMGELEGAKPTSNEIECLAKPCRARRATGVACTFASHSVSKSNGIFEAFFQAGVLPLKPQHSCYQLIHILTATRNFPPCRDDPRQND